MDVFRIAKSIYIDDLTGIGAKSVGGRWNFKGVSLLYTSSSVALCTLECLAHFPIAFAPKDMVLATIEIPENEITFVDQSLLPENWQKVPPPKVLKLIGLDWVKKQTSLVLRVPSTIVPQEFNYLINPLHPSFHKVKIKEKGQIFFDQRILK